MSRQSIANYTDEQAQFRELIESDSDLNILMFRGASGSGKSHLMTHCLTEIAKDKLPIVKFDLKSGGDTIPTLFNALGSKVGRPQLPLFSERVAGLIGQTAEENAVMWRMQLRQQLREIGRNSDLDTRKDWYRQLTYAWFADTEQLDRPLLLALDTYEASGSEFDAWFKDEFLYGAAYTNKLRILIGGQTVPEPAADLPAVISVQQLKGVKDAQEWMKWAQAHQIELPSLEWMARFCEKQSGNPAEIIKILETFPKVAGGAQGEGESIYRRRKRIRETIDRAFGLEDLKNLCSDMEIDHENFPQTKSSYIRELIAHLPRINRYEEFIGICQEERPHFEWL